jgi:hypothetical protein
VNLDFVLVVMQKDDQSFRKVSYCHRICQKEGMGKPRKNIILVKQPPAQGELGRRACIYIYIYIYTALCDGMQLYDMRAP